jgi:23S rRNA-/tRNA-specific pseudouridylate synthase
MGWPILGDPQYGTEASRRASEGLEYQQLCAKELEFDHPLTGVHMALRSGMDAVKRKEE